MSMQAPVQSSELEEPERLLHRLDWQLVRRLDGILHGDYRSLFMGAGLDFAELREYQPPDDIRHIDWNVTARMDMPYVRQYTEDREVTAWFLLDLSPSMAFGAQDRRKESVLVDLVGCWRACSRATGTASGRSCTTTMTSLRFLPAAAGTRCSA